MERPGPFKCPYCGVAFSDEWFNVVLQDAGRDAQQYWIEWTNCSACKRLLIMLVEPGRAPRTPDVSAPEPRKRFVLWPPLYGRRDYLTKLWNREKLDVDLALLARRSNAASPLAMLMIDIDHFKSFNDKHGHKGGDVMLQRIAALLLRRAPQGRAYRYGGEELVVLAPNHDRMQAHALAERIRREVESTNKEFGITVSIGVAIFPDHATTPAELQRAADMALYDAKGAGRNRVTVAAQGTIESRPSGA
jgi:diguanylate cyclase (GGDEF)-like protein